jgi:hypothetical protein
MAVPAQSCSPFPAYPAYPAYPADPADPASSILKRPYKTQGGEIADLTAPRRNGRWV